MSTVLPPGEAVHRALRWISEQRQASPERRLMELLDEAGRRFDLTPFEQESLHALLTIADPVH